MQSPISHERTQVVKDGTSEGLGGVPRDKVRRITKTVEESPAESVREVRCVEGGPSEYPGGLDVFSGDIWTDGV